MNARQRRKAGRARLRANPDLRARFVAWRLTERPEVGQGIAAWRFEGQELGALCSSCADPLPDPPRYYARKECYRCRHGGLVWSPAAGRFLDPPIPY